MIELRNIEEINLLSLSTSYEISHKIQIKNKNNLYSVIRFLYKTLNIVKLK